MKIYFLIFSLLISNLAFSQSEKEIETAVQNLKTAMLAEDDVTLRSLTSADLTYGHSSGGIENQEQFLAVFAANKNDYQKWDITDQKITFHGKKTALVRHNVNGEIVSNGNTNNLKIGVLMVWSKEKGGWKLLARQAFRLPVS